MAIIQDYLARGLAKRGFPTGNLECVRTPRGWDMAFEGRMAAAALDALAAQHLRPADLPAVRRAIANGAVLEFRRDRRNPLFDQVRVTTNLRNLGRPGLIDDADAEAFRRLASLAARAATACSAVLSRQAVKLEAALQPATWLDGLPLEGPETESLDLSTSGGVILTRRAAPGLVALIEIVPVDSLPVPRDRENHLLSDNFSQQANALIHGTDVAYRLRATLKPALTRAKPRAVSGYTYQSGPIWDDRPRDRQPTKRLKVLISVALMGLLADHAATRSGCRK